MKLPASIVPLLQKVLGRPARPQLDARTTQLQELPCPPGRVLFLGDSITDLGEWSEWFPELACMNRGISGDTVEGVRKRLGWTVNAPSVISLLIGTNDLGGAGRTRNPRAIAEQTRQLVRELQVAAPGARLLLHSVMPRERALRHAVQTLNGHYRQIAADAGVTYVDLWPAMADGVGRMRAELSDDEVHLTGAGYRAWVDVLRPHLAPYSTR